MHTDFVKIYDRLFDWCKRENFSGYDPFDGLNSKFFQATPLKYFSISRLAWLQMVKRCGKNLRPLLKIEKGVNAKGIALFALAELSRFRTTQDEKHSQNAKSLLNILLKLKIQNSELKSSFGYNFDWQSRAFFAPQGTPTIVPTAFAAQAFIEAYEIFGVEEYLEISKQVCEFIVQDLNRIDETAEEVSFSYTPLDKSVIFNASLLAGECLARVGVLTQNQSYLHLAEKTALYVIRRQAENGSWAYGSKLRHNWVDNFHTAYILLSLYRLQKLIPKLQNESANALKIGYKFWLENFFLSDGTPKYYDTKTYPIDIHSAAAAIVSLVELAEFDSTAIHRAEKILAWSCSNMRDEEGFFYYQKLENKIIKTPFIRWSQAWMAFSVSRLVEVRDKHAR